MLFQVQACGKPVGVHISRARSLEQAAEEQNPLLEGCDPDTTINKLLRLIRSHSDKRAAVTAALKAVMAVPSKPKPSSPDRCGSDLVPFRMIYILTCFTVGGGGQ